MKKSEQINNEVVLKNSDNNNIFQGCNVTINSGNIRDLISVLKDTGNYDAIQQIAKEMNDDLAKTHPLHPIFAAEYDNELEKLVSIPKAEDALEIYPKNIKGKFKLDYSKYPNMDENETLWDYAYRTQRVVELETTEYKEYLGDEEDPYPIISSDDIVTTVIKAPPFPDAIKVMLIAGKYSIPQTIRRVPCEEYGKVVIETIGSSNLIKMRIEILASNKNRLNITFSRDATCTLRELLLVEQLLDSIEKTKRFVVKNDNTTYIDAKLNEEELKSDLIVNAKYRIDYIKKLLFIEEYFDISFEVENKKIEDNEIRCVQVLYTSLNNKYLRTKSGFADGIRLGYKDLSDEILEGVNETGLFSIESNLEITLMGQSFVIGKYITSFKNVKINNVKSVLKNIKRKKKDILITLKPQHGETFEIYEKFKDITVK